MLRPQISNPKSSAIVYNPPHARRHPCCKAFCAIVLLTLRHSPVSVVAEMLTRTAPQGQKDNKTLCLSAKLVCFA